MTTTMYTGIPHAMTANAPSEGNGCCHIGTKIRKSETRVMKMGMASQTCETI